MRYQNGSKKNKTKILDEFCATCDYSRKYAIRILNGKVEPRKKKPGPKPKYTPSIVMHLLALWEAMNRMCSKKMKAGLPDWLPFYKEADHEEKALLLSMSASTIDRLLKPDRERFERRRGIGTTQPALKSLIPIKLLDGDVKEPGFVEADTVAHCGDKIEGSYAHTVTVTDLFSGWTENRAMWTKAADGVVKQIGLVEKALPFGVLGFASDNGTEFLNDALYQYWTHRVKAVEFVRRRPYKKNDSAHVEQKNFTHVRELFGYDRLDMPDCIELMNEIYRVYWNPLWNFFTPVMKLVSKTRVGSRIVKKYDRPKTAYQRLLESDKLSAQEKKKLRGMMAGKNPFFLKRELEKKLKLHRELVAKHRPPGDA
jgi:hypothetical protein